MARVICHNAWRLRSLVQDGLDDCRTYQVLAAIQMFGSGKTTIAKEFLSQLRSPTVKECFEKFLDRATLADNQKAFQRDAYQKLRDNTVLILIDCQDLRDWAGLSSRLSAQVPSVSGLVDHRVLTAYFGRPEWQARNIFFVLDEMGGWTTNEVHSLLGVFKAFLETEVRAKSERIVVLMLMGKGLTLQALGSGSSRSPLSYAWIKLRMLQLGNIKELITQLQRGDAACLPNVSDLC